MKSKSFLDDYSDLVQAGDWGLTIIETKSGEQFLRKIGWQTLKTNQRSNKLFKIALIHN
jgi:hypothetical protein